MRKFRLSRPAVSSEQTLDRRGSLFHKYEPFMARWRSIAKENYSRAPDTDCHDWKEIPSQTINPDAKQNFADW